MKNDLERENTMNEFVETVQKLGENKRLEDLRCKK